MGINTNAVQRLYTAYFSRPADPVGLAYWESKLPADRAATQAELTALAHSGFSASTEFSNMYTGLTNAQIVQLAYQNLFGRSAEPAGEVYWAARLASGAETFAGLVLQLTYSAQGTDATAIASKLSAATAFTAALDTTAEITGYAGTGSSASARGWLATVTDAATLATATAAATLNTAVAAAVAAGSTNGGGTTPNGTTFTLTNGTDNATANVFNASLVYTPAGNARINALQDEDTLTGAGVNATLNATLGNIDASNTGASGAIVTPKLNGISTVNVAFSGSGANAVTELDLQDSTAPTAVNITRVSDGISTATVDNMKAMPTTMSVADSNNAQQNVSFLFTNGGASGAADASTMTLSNVNIATLTVQENAQDGTMDQGVESLTLVSSGAANTISTLAAEDVQRLTINGSQNLAIGAESNAAGSLTTVDASALTGNLTFTLTNGIMTATPDGTSGSNIAFSLTSGTGADSIRVSEQIGTNDSIATGAGTDTLRMSNGTAAVPTQNLDAIALNTANNNVTGVETIQLWNVDGTAGTANTLALRADEADGDQNIELLDHSNDTTGTTTYNVVNLSAAEALGVSIAHSGSTTLANPAAANNALTDNMVDLDAADGVTAARVTITNGVNSDPRFNFELYTDSDRALNTTGATHTFTTLQDAGTVNAVTGLTIQDSDSESNTVRLLADGYLSGVAQGNGTAYTSVTLTAGTAGAFLNLDATANMYGLDVSGNSTDAAVITDVGAGAAERLSAATINASAFGGNAIVRVGNNFNSALGAQSITMGAGNDTVIFDRLSDTHAGLTNADTVAGGAGSDVLAIDGNALNLGEVVSLGASEWANVSGFETLRLVGNGAFGSNAQGLFNGNAYNLTLTDQLVDNNGTNGANIAIINDNGDVAGGSANSGVTIDARGLSISNAFSYNGQETNNTVAVATTMTADRFIVADGSINGSDTIDGGANQTGAGVTGGTLAGHERNMDVLEVRNAAVVNLADLVNVSNVGQIDLSNDTTATQVVTLELDSTTVDRLVNSTANADAANIAGTFERLIVNVVNDTVDTTLNMQASAVTNAALRLSVVGQDGNDTIVAGAGDDTISAGNGANSITGNGGNDTILSGTGADTITGDAGDDSITSGDGNDSVSGGTGTDTILTGNGDDTIVGADNADSIDGGAGTNVLQLSASYTPSSDAHLENVGIVTLSTAGTVVDLSNQAGEAFTITGSTGADTITSADQADSITGSGGNDSITSGTGNDTVTTTDGNDTISAGTGDDSITSGAGNDSITAAAGADTIISGAGSDTIDLGAADAAIDVVRTNIGTDVQAMGSALLTAADIITSFTAGAGGDIIDLAGGFVAAGTLASALNATFGTDDIAAAQMLSEALGTTALNAAGFDGKFIYEDTTAGGFAAGSDFTNQASIDLAVNAIVNGFSGDTTQNNTNMLIVLYDANSHAAIFQYSEGANDAGIQATELALVSVIGTVAVDELTDANFG